MARRLNSKDKNFAADFESLLFAKREVEEDVAAQVRGIIADVRKRGDAALVELRRVDDGDRRNDIGVALYQRARNNDSLDAFAGLCGSGCLRTGIYDIASRHRDTCNQKNINS